MANSFLNSDLLVQAVENASILLSNNLVAANLLNRNVEDEIVDRDTGGSVRVKVRPELTASIDEQNRGQVTLSKTDNQQSAVTIDATKYIYLKQDLPTSQQTWDLESFTEEVVEPAALAIREQVDKFMVRKIAGGYSRNVISDDSSIGTAPSDVNDILNAMETMNDQKAPMARRVGLIGSTAHANLLGLDQFTSADFGDDAPVGLREGALSKRYGYDYFMDQNVGTHPFGDTTGTVVTNGAVTQGDDEVAIDGLNTSDGVIREGARFTISGDSQVYTVTDDVFYSGSSATLPIAPSAQTGSSDDKGITFETAHTQDTFYNRDFVLGAIVAPQPLQGTLSETATFDNITIRASISSDFSGSDGATDEILWDVYVGGKVLKPETGVVLQS